MASVTRRRVWTWGVSLLGLVACVAVLVVVFDQGKAKAAPSAPTFLGEITEAEVPGGVRFGDLAVDRKNGNLFASQNGRVVELSSYGVSIRSFGTNGEAGGQISQPLGVAVEQATGDVYVQDSGNRRVDKFDGAGSFLRAFGLDVNKVKTNAVEVKEAKSETPTAEELAEANVCVAGEECQQGKTGSGPGAFEEWPGESKDVAVGGAAGKELLYVGDKARIEVFKPNGEFVEQLSLSSLSSEEKVRSIAADPAGNVYFFDSGVAGVHLAETNGSGELELSSTVFDGSSTGVQALAVGGGSLYVADSSSSFRVFVYETGKPSEPPAEFAGSEPGQIVSADALTVNGAGVVYAAGFILNEEGYNVNKLDFYGSLTAMEAAYGAPPPVKPAVSAQVVRASVEASTATVEALVNPQLRETTYQVEYGTEPCSGGCTKALASPASLGTVTKTEHQVLVHLGGLEVGQLYHYRLIVTNAAGIVEVADRVFRIGNSSSAGPNGLPDGRFYEQASPTNKYGNQPRLTRPVFVSTDGDGVMYGATGGITANAANGAFDPEFVSERTSHGWVTRATMPLPVEGQKESEEYVGSSTVPTLLVPSSDLSRLLFSTERRAPYVGPPDEPSLGNNIYLEGPNPFAEPEWVGRSQIAGAPGGSPNGSHTRTAGGSSDLKTIYFVYDGDLLPEASGLYEYREGHLSDAGVLPSGETGSGLAVPAAQFALDILGRPEATIPSPAGFENQFSQDGSRIFFVREHETGVWELYVHITAPDGSAHTVLVSQSQLAGHVGAPAPHGASAVPSTMTRAIDALSPEHGGSTPPATYVFASPDGSHAFFQSTDRLTEAAPEDSALKTYDFDVDTGTSEYLSEINGSIATVSSDGLSLLFENTATSPFQLERWVAGPHGGTATPIAELPAVAHGSCGPVLCIGPAYVSSDGKVATFATESPIAGFNDGGTHYQRENPDFGERPESGTTPWPNVEAFRYDAQADELSCVSCPPSGMVPASNAVLSIQSVSEANNSGPDVTSGGLAMSADGSSVFFETRDALLPGDVNGTSDVYEWRAGRVYAISSGRSSQRSFFVGMSESGGDVFFATTEGIVPGDTDDGYDVYDARIPRPGDAPPPEAIPCEGAVCQGPPSVPNLLGQPASEAFNGAGNPVSAVPPPRQATPKSLTRAQKLARALNACKHRKDIRKRKRCERQARHKYGAHVAGSHSAAKQARHHNGRGK